jgi:hypothetical protein
MLCCRLEFGCFPPRVRVCFFVSGMEAARGGGSVGDIGLLACSSGAVLALHASLAPQVVVLRCCDQLLGPYCGPPSTGLPLHVKLPKHPHARASLPSQKYYAQTPSHSLTHSRCVMCALHVPAMIVGVICHLFDLVLFWSGCWSVAFRQPLSPTPLLARHPLAPAPATRSNSSGRLCSFSPCLFISPRPHFIPPSPAPPYSPLSNQKF